MLSNLENTPLIIIVTRKEELKTQSELLEWAGLKVSRTASIGDLLQRVQDNPSVILQFPTEDRNQDIHKDMMSFVRGLPPSTPCVIFAAEELSLLMNNLKEVSSQFSKNYNKKTLGEIEKAHIINTLESNGWKYKTAAKILGIDRSTLYRKLKKYGIRKDR